MKISGNILNRETTHEIRQLIKNNDLQQAIKKLSILIEGNMHLYNKINIVQSIKGSIIKCKYDEYLGLISAAEAKLERNRIMYSILDILEELDKKTKNHELADVS